MATGIKPRHKKVDAILNLQSPSNIKQLHSFLSMVNYYHDMWPCCTHILAPLTAIMGKGTFCWDPIYQHNFNQMKSLVAADILLAYPDHTHLSMWRQMLVNNSLALLLSNLGILWPTIHAS